MGVLIIKIRVKWQSYMKMNLLRLHLFYKKKYFSLMKSFPMLQENTHTQKKKLTTIALMLLAYAFIPSLSCNGGKWQLLHFQQGKLNHSFIYKWKAQILFVNIKKLSVLSVCHMHRVKAF